MFSACKERLVHEPQICFFFSGFRPRKVYAACGYSIFRNHMLETTKTQTKNKVKTKQKKILLLISHLTDKGITKNVV